MGKSQDPGSGINIPDPPHCKPVCFSGSDPIRSVDPDTDSESGSRRAKIEKSYEISCFEVLGVLF
jgi:hypothetical protein